jgi:hypothetical protein
MDGATKVPTYVHHDESPRSRSHCRSLTDNLDRGDNVASCDHSSVSRVEEDVMASSATVFDNQEPLNRIYVRGISKKATVDSIRQHFAAAGEVTEVIWAGPDNPQLKGTCKVVYATPDEAEVAVRTLNGHQLHGVVLSVRLDIPPAMRANGINKFISVKRAVKVMNDDSSSSSTGKRTLEESSGNDEPANGEQIRESLSQAQAKKIRKQQWQEHAHTSSSDNFNASSNSTAVVRYTCDGVVVDGTFYPTCRGKYLMKLLQLMAAQCSELLSASESAAIGAPSSTSLLPILNILVGGKKFGNAQAKEITESMAMVSAVWRLFELVGIQEEAANNEVTVYVLGDGKVASILFVCWLPVVMLLCV